MSTYRPVDEQKQKNNFPRTMVQCSNIPDCGFKSMQVHGWSVYWYSGGAVYACCIKCLRELTERLLLDPANWKHFEGKYK